LKALAPAMIALGRSRRIGPPDANPEPTVGAAHPGAVSSRKTIAAPVRGW
jgi:hypothetical protein